MLAEVAFSPLPAMLCITAVQPLFVIREILLVPAPRLHPVCLFISRHLHCCALESHSKRSSAFGWYTHSECECAAVCQFSPCTVDVLPTCLYVQVAVWQCTHPDGLNVFHYPSGQVEGHFADGRKEVIFADGMARIVQDG